MAATALDSRMLGKRRFTAVLLGVILAWGGCSQRGGPPYSPEDALRTFEIHPDFAIELFASEPDVVDPVAMAFGPNGRIWVVENSGYPLDVGGRRGRIKLLEDTDGDGRPDAATVFADGLTMPTGILPWKDGVLVTDAPDVMFLADTDGDGRADVRDRVLSGFALTNPQHTVSTPVYGLDNWIYLAHEGTIQSVVFAEEFGDTGSEIHFPDAPDGPRAPVDGRCVRFRPETLELEPLAGASQFGLAFSKWGDLLTQNNTYHVRHEVIPARYLERNPSLRVTRTAQNVFEDGNPASVYPITLNPKFELLSGIGQMTSAAGLTPYLGGAFPGYEGVTFVGESVHNVVHADRWESAESTYVARPLLEGQEFLASKDAWFRPVNFTVGPEGALYVIDYYRHVIEHPEWTSAATYTSDSLYDGEDRGRIWRVTPKDGLARVAPRLRGAAGPELVSRLRSGNSWDRMTAQQLLVERQSREVVPALEDLARDDGHPLPRLHALWTLEGIGGLEDALVSQALQSAIPGIRKNAIRLAEPRFRQNPARWRPLLLALEDDPDAHVRLQLVLTLGEAPSPRLRQVRERMLLGAVRDPWVQVAALSWPTVDPAALLDRISLKLHSVSSAERLLERIAALAGRDRAAVSRLLVRAGRMHDTWRQASILRGLRQGLAAEASGAPLPARDRDRILRLFANGDGSVRRAALDLLEETGISGSEVARAALAEAARTAADGNASVVRRADAVHLLSLSDSESHADLFRRLIGPSEDEAVQAAAVAAHGRSRSDGVAAFLLERWTKLPSAARTAAGEVLTSNDERTSALVAALERGGVQPWTLAFRQRRRLLMHPNPALRERARRALTATERDREAVVARYRAALARRAGDAARGAQVYERTCKECHRLGGEGHELGPDLGTVRTRPALNLLHDILLPSESIAQTYESYVIELADGSLLEGLLGESSPGSVALRREGGQEEAIDRSRIRSMRIAQLSAMPDDFETRITPPAMADLIRFIQSAPALRTE